MSFLNFVKTVLVLPKLVTGDTKAISDALVLPNFINGTNTGGGVAGFLKNFAVIPQLANDKKQQDLINYDAAAGKPPVDDKIINSLYNNYGSMTYYSGAGGLAANGNSGINGYSSDIGYTGIGPYQPGTEPNYPATSSSNSSDDINWSNVITTGISTIPGLINSIFNGGKNSTTTVTGSSTSSNSGSLSSLLGLDKILSGLNINPQVTATIPSWVWVVLLGLGGLLIFKLVGGKK